LAAGSSSISNCQECAPGTAAAAGSASCTPCIAGTSWSAARAGTCTVCKDITCTENDYKVGCTTLSDTLCLTCPEPPTNGQLTNPTDPTCPWTCNTGFYKTSSGTCQPCQN
jgi:hypothetical protein